MKLDFVALRGHGDDPAAYGGYLKGQLFEDAEVRRYYDEAWATTEAADRDLRMRLAIDRTAPELHPVRWETLRHPVDDTWLLCKPRAFFSRYLGSTDYRPVTLRPRGDLRALILIANPTDIESYRPGGRRLAAVDVSGELARIKESLRGIPFRLLANHNEAKARPTLENLVAALRAGDDILYVVCHGALEPGTDPGHAQPWLWLEDDHGGSARVAGEHLVEVVRPGGAAPPSRARVLPECRDRREPVAGPGRRRSLALGPRFAEAGVPAVMAMQGEVTMETIKELMPVFFAQLAETGLVTAPWRSLVRR